MFRRPQGARNEVQYNCCAFGHFARDCPLPNQRYPKPAVRENTQAGPQGRVGPPNILVPSVNSPIISVYILYELVT